MSFLVAFPRHCSYSLRRAWRDSRADPDDAGDPVSMGPGGEAADMPAEGRAENVRRECVPSGACPGASGAGSRSRVVGRSTLFTGGFALWSGLIQSAFGLLFLLFLVSLFFLFSLSRFSSFLFRCKEKRREVKRGKRGEMGPRPPGTGLGCCSRSPFVARSFSLSSSRNKNCCIDGGGGGGGGGGRRGKVRPEKPWRGEEGQNGGRRSLWAASAGRHGRTVLQHSAAQRRRRGWRAGGLLSLSGKPGQGFVEFGQPPGQPGNRTRGAGRPRGQWAASPWRPFSLVPFPLLPSTPL